MRVSQVAAAASIPAICAPWRAAVICQTFGAARAHAGRHRRRRTRGLVLAHLLDQAGISSVILENKARDYVQQRVRAGVLEQGTVDLLDEMGVGERMHREGSSTTASSCATSAAGTGYPMSDLTGGRAITIYGQQEVVKDLIDARLAAGQELHFEVDDVSVHDLETDRPRIRFTRDGEAQELECDAIAGCDGFHGDLPPVGARGRGDGLQPRVPVRVARDPRAGRALHRRADLRQPRARLRAAQPALARAQPALHPVRPARRHRQLARRAHLGGDAHPLRDRRTAGRSRRGRSSRRASRRCAASS